MQMKKEACWNKNDLLQNVAAFCILPSAF